MVRDDTDEYRFTIGAETTKSQRFLDNRTAAIEQVRLRLVGKVQCYL